MINKISYAITGELCMEHSNHYVDPTTDAHQQTWHAPVVSDWNLPIPAMRIPQQRSPLVVVVTIEHVSVCATLLLYLARGSEDSASALCKRSSLLLLMPVLCTRRSNNLSSPFMLVNQPLVHLYISLTVVGVQYVSRRGPWPGGARGFSMGYGPSVFLFGV